MARQQGHTPGPWDLYSAHPAEQYVDVPVENPTEDQSHRSLFRIHHDDNVPQGEAEANAMLISAAPEMLEALERIADMDNAEGITAYQLAEIAQAAIQKAKGGL